MLLQRALVTLTLGPLALYLIYLGDWFFFIPVAIFVFIGLRELLRMFEGLNWHVSLPLIAPLIIFQFIAAKFQRVDWMLGGLALSFLLTSIYALWQYENDKAQNVTATWMASLGTVLLLGWVGSHIIWLREMPSETAFQWTALGILGTWFADTAAYLFGRQFGKHKMTPRLSPKKSWEGYAAGLVLTVLVGGLSAVFLLNLPLMHSLILLALIGFTSPAGDLVFSLIKRESGVKDSGNFLPGHGGALDRIDTILWSVLITYYFVILFV